MAKKKKVIKSQRTANDAAVETEPAARAEVSAPAEQKPARAPKAPETKFAFVDDERFWKAGAGVVVAIAVFLRFYDLTLKPFHHDEGVNGFFLKTLFNDGTYKYDPANYHGPTLYYISLAFVDLFGLNSWAVRASVAVFGVAMVVLVLYLRRYLGTVGTLLAALFVALSPGLVFISRYFIHEIFFVFLSLGIVVAIVLYIERESAGPVAIGWMSLILLTCFMPSVLNLAAYVGSQTGSDAATWVLRLAFFTIDAFLVYQIIRQLLAWDQGRVIYLILASACAGLMFATKETAFITLGTLAMACVSVWVWRGIVNGPAWRKNYMGAIIFAHVVAAFALLLSRAALADGYKVLTDSYFSSFRPHEPFAFYTILFLLIGSLAAWGLFLAGYKGEDTSTFDEPAKLTWSGFREALGTDRRLMIGVAAAAIIFIYLNVLFFSSFFTYSEGISKAFEAYAIWSKTGNKDHTQNGMLAYIRWGFKVEAPIMIFSVLGILIALLRPKHRLAMYIAFWAGGLFLAYTLIPYKTPWLNLSFLMPMAIIGGYGVGELVSSASTRLKFAGVALAIAGVALLAYQTQQLSFVRYDDDDEPYVYAHTKRGFLDMIAKINYYADKSGKGKDATIDIVSTQYWPMTWYMNDYGHANFFGNLIDVSASEMIVAEKNAQDAEMIRRYANHYKWVDVYPLRPGVNLVLLVRNDIADPDAKDLSKITEYKTVPGYTQ